MRSQLFGCKARFRFFRHTPGHADDALKKSKSLFIYFVSNFFFMHP